MTFHMSRISIMGIIFRGICCCPSKRFTRMCRGVIFLPTPEATAPRATYAAVSYVADDICESACSERQKKCGEELGQHVVFSVQIPRNYYECLVVFCCGT